MLKIAKMLQKEKTTEADLKESVLIKGIKNGEQE